VLPDRILFWVSVTDIYAEVCPPNAPIMPAILDTGFNHAFLMAGLQLATWTSQGFYENLPRAGISMKAYGEVLPLYLAGLWLHPNKPGTRERGHGSPYRLEMSSGIALPTVRSSLVKPWPLLGLEVVRFSNVRVEIDGQQEFVSVQTP
jgi:hypothetical protein